MGLDTMAHVIKTMQENLNEQSDPVLLATRHAQGAAVDLGFLGQKTKAGLLQTRGPRNHAVRAGQRLATPQVARPTRSGRMLKSLLPSA